MTPHAGVLIAAPAECPSALEGVLQRQQRLDASPPSPLTLESREREVIAEDPAVYVMAMREQDVLDPGDPQ